MAHILFKRQLKLYKKFEKLSSLFYCNLAQNSKKKTAFESDYIQFSYIFFDFDWLFIDEMNLSFFAQNRA